MRHVVIGGGIAGVCCVEELCRMRPDDEVVLLSSSTVLKGIDSVVRITKTIEEVTVTERDLTAVHYSNLSVQRSQVTSIDTQRRLVHVAEGDPIAFDRLCICAGARPKVLGFQHERIVTLRDTQSVEEFARQLTAARRIAVVGNGGIALELIGAVRDVEVVWVLKHGHIGDAFFDVDAAEFLLGVLQQQQDQQQQDQQRQQQDQQQQQLEQQQAGGTCRGDERAAARGEAGAAAAPGGSSRGGSEAGPGSAADAAVRGHAAGPKWVDQLPKGRLPANVHLERNALVEDIRPGPAADGAAAAAAAPPPGGAPWPLHMRLSTGECLGVDLVVQAIGVEPATGWMPAELKRAADGGILVSGDLETSVAGVYAAGDCCTVDPGQTAPHWFQMRLWTQARLMGCHAAAAMAGALDSEVLSFSFELFTHVTRFLGMKVVLLGLYNGQKLQGEPPGDVALYSRALGAGAGATFVRVLLLRGRLQGAVLVGETDLEEAFENLILDGLDLSQYGPALLDPDVELDHVFD